MMVMEPSPFHEGEQRVQARLGVRDDIEPWARKVVRSCLPEQHRAFYRALPYLVVAARDGRGRPWVTLLGGEPGFVHSPESATLAIGRLPAEGDALHGALAPGADIGVLGIELHTRRRNRVNGRIAALGADGFTLAVEQAYGNCPQYIHPRRARPAPSRHGRPVGRVSTSLSGRLRHWIERADTFFIASGHRGEGESLTYGMDASHRGGAPGFVKIDGERRLRFPDYAGNNHFNTIGNLVLDSRAGLLFVDFERGNLLQLTGRTTIDWQSAEPDSFPGARRVVSLDIDEAVEVEGALPIHWSGPESAVRELRVVAKERESDDVTSFVMAARDGSPVPDFSAGQYLPIELDVPGEATPVTRTYSLSCAPGEGLYRISVKREPRGLVSRHLHDQVDVGYILSAGAPAGEFTLDHDTKRPIVLVSVGVGLTPLVSMLHELAARRDGRPVWFVHGARNGRRHPLAAEVRHLTERSPDLHLHVAYSRARGDDLAGRDYDSAGRIDGDLLARLLPGLDADFYLCGPTAFMASLQHQLGGRGVPAACIHSESFGPSQS